MSRTDFDEQCRDLARDLHRLPTVVRDTVDRDGRRLVADPLADRMRQHLSGPYAVVLRRHGITTTPTGITLGGTRVLLRGGATASDLIPGVEWGRAGTRRARYTRRTRTGTATVTRRTSRQFRTPRPFLVPALDDDRLDDDWLRLVDAALATTSTLGGP